MENTPVEMTEEELVEVNGGWIHLGLMFGIAAAGAAFVGGTYLWRRSQNN